MQGLSQTPREWNVREFGARGDGQTVDTAALQRALDTCGKAGGGVVRFPPGVYLTQPLELRSHVTILLENGAILQASREPKDFMRQPGDWLQARSSSDFLPLLGGRNLTNVALIGQGIIDGAGEVWWPAAEEARRRQPGYTLPRPRLIVLTRCRNVRLSGITLRNAPTFHFVPVECEDVWIENLTVQAPDHAANTDGIDPSLSRRVVITNCIFDVGDDNIAIKSGRALPDRPFGCEDITVVHCRFFHGHGLSIGSETVGGVRGLRVRGCVFQGTENGIRIKSHRGRGGMVEDLLYEDIQMTNVERAITFTAYYPRIPAEDSAQPLSPETPRYRNIRVRNLTATCYENAGVIIGLPEAPIENVYLENIRIIANRTGLELRHVRQVRLENVEVRPVRGAPLIVRDSTGTGLP
ncbi:MAG: glycoside hydrolase family 28 protein [Verrucomicrobiota bacterium]|nr:glycoside hydrolase family 28 protein [Limisphaera sp.]MDW8380657.1 glycoside hydrolase family 28 protein [Verrucomicrobiota bacterium]